MGKMFISFFYSVAENHKGRADGTVRLYREYQKYFFAVNLPAITSKSFDMISVTFS